jgi:uroporphyrin-III C-methyltransferase / precorrin-2 dehydrogenase / sirohydrochlorin ferrochelatase
MSTSHEDRSGRTPQGPAAAGRVSLVGAGPGDPDLLTVRAARRIGEADVIFTDRLAGKAVLELARPGAEIVSVGKSKGEHSVAQADIHAWMIAAARDGRRVVRLKGGDPFVFGRGGEEVEALRAAGIEVEVVPGVTAALACAASAQIPLTHREDAQAVTFVTGHAALGREPDLDWVSLARPNQTVVVYMGVGMAETIAHRLMAAGRSPDTPVSLIENGALPNELRVAGRLSDMATLIERAGITGPAVLVIGEVVALARDVVAGDGRTQAETPTAATGAKPTLSDLWSLLP